MFYRVTFGFSGAGVGWSETHACVNSSSDPSVVAPALIDICQKRANLLGREFNLVALRISRYSLDGSTRAKGVKLVNNVWSPVGQTASYAAEPAQVALMVRGDSLPNGDLPQFDANENQTFLGGPIDSCVDNAGIIQLDKGNLGSNFATWRSAMLAARMGWLADQMLVDAPIGLIVQNVNGTVGITTSVNLPNTIVVGQNYRARIRRVNAGASPLNGEVIVHVTSPTSLQTLEVIGIALAQQGGFIKLYKQVQPFVQYGDLILQGRAGNHKRGRPFGSPPGRAKKRIRG